MINLNDGLLNMRSLLEGMELSNYKLPIKKLTLAHEYVLNKPFREVELEPYVPKPIYGVNFKISFSQE